MLTNRPLRKNKDRMISTTTGALMHQQQQPIRMHHRPMRYPKRRLLVSSQQQCVMWIAFLVGMVVVSVLSPRTQLIDVSSSSSSSSPRSSSSIWGVMAASSSTTTSPEHRRSSFRWSQLGSDRNNQKRVNNAPGSATGTSSTTHPMNETTGVYHQTKRRQWGICKTTSSTNPTDNLNNKIDPMNEMVVEAAKKMKATTKKTGAGRRRGWFGWSLKSTANQTSSSTHGIVTSTTGTNEMTAEQPPPLSSEQQQRPMPDHSPTGVIMIGGPPSYKSPSGGDYSPVMLSLLSHLFLRAVKVLFTTWLTRRMASNEEESIIQPSRHYCWECINDKFVRDTWALQAALQAPPPNVPLKTWKRHLRRSRGTERPSSNNDSEIQDFLSNVYKRTVVLIELRVENGGSGNIDLEQLPDVVTFLLQQQRQHAFGSCALSPGNKSSQQKQSQQPMELEVVFSLTSPGGTVARYGLAASQLQRLKARRATNRISNHNINGVSEVHDDDDMENPDDNITTTVCVDSIAASGGYMIASQADQVIAAPFATVGSVGVITEFLNFNELAKQYGVQPVIVKAGEMKNPLSQWGPVNQQDLDREQQQLAKVHATFKDLVLQGRCGLLEKNMDQVTDGSLYLGQEALELGMIDAVMTTEEYILVRMEAGDRVLKLHPFTQQGHDIPLTHVRSWISHKLRTTMNVKSLVSPRAAVQTWTWIGFINHAIRTYVQRW